MPDIIRLGSLCFNDKPVKTGSLYQLERLAIVDTNPDFPISWVKLDNGNKLVADRAVCANISWKQLDRIGFIKGRVIEIDNERYLCRSLKVGRKDGQPNEWDTILETTSDLDSLWHYSNIYFWGQESGLICESGKRNESRVVRGWKSARYRKEFKEFTATPGMGFRPVLEPVSAMPAFTADQIGYYVTLHLHEGGIISGRLCDFTEYDIVLSGDIPGWITENAEWAYTDTNSKVVIDRSAVICMQK